MTNVSENTIKYFANTSNAQHKINGTLNLTAVYPHIKNSLIKGEEVGREKIDALKYYSAINENVPNDFGNYYSTINLATDPGKLAKAALDDANNQVNYKQFSNLGFGKSACAHAVSEMLSKVPNLKSAYSNLTTDLAKQLKKIGFIDIGEPSVYKSGDIVFLNNYGHVGVISDVIGDIPYLVHNSSSRNQVVRITLKSFGSSSTSCYRLGG